MLAEKYAIIIKKQMNFLCSEMTFLRYFIPLIKEGNKRKIKSTLIIKKNNKYNCPYRDKNAKILHKLSQAYDFEIISASKLKDEKKIFFAVDGTDCDLPKLGTKVSLDYDSGTYYDGFYSKYKNFVDFWIFPSHKWSTEFNKHPIPRPPNFQKQDYNFTNPKCLFIGSPKFDEKINPKDVLEKYSFLKNQNKKKALIFFPKPRDVKKRDLLKIYKTLKSLGYLIVVKNREKDRIEDKSLMGDYYFEDSWYPHTSMELLAICDLVVAFSSTGILEFVASRKPIVNFHIKPFEKHMPFLYESDFCLNEDIKKSEEELSCNINHHVSQNYFLQFNRTIEDFLPNIGNSSKLILDKLL